MIRKTIQLCFIVVIVITISGCYPKEEITIGNSDLVITNYNPGYYFSYVHTYYLSDSIYYISEDSIVHDQSMDPFVISELERNLDALGYTRLTVYDNMNPPSVVVVVSLAPGNTGNIYSYPWYDGWGNGWGYPGYHWGYTWSGFNANTSYESGTLVWNMFDPARIDINTQTIFIQWTGIINGLLGATSSTANSRISKGIDQAFKQSPYLIPNY